jgi:hypothetical protein
MLIVFLLAFFALPAGSEDADIMTGIWIYQEPLNNDGVAIQLMDILPDQTVYYLTQWFFPDGTHNSGRQYVGKWTKYKKNQAQLKTGDNTLLNAVFYEDGHLEAKKSGNGGSKMVFYKFIAKSNEPEKSENNNGLMHTTEEPTRENIKTGVRLEPGEYYIGEDLPAGNYRFEFAGSTSYVYFRKNPDSSIWSERFDLDKDHQVYAKMKLTEGGRLDVSVNPVIIMEAVSLFGD